MFQDTSGLSLHTKTVFETMHIFNKVKKKSIGIHDMLHLLDLKNNSVD